MALRSQDRIRLGGRFQSLARQNTDASRITSAQHDTETTKGDAREENVQFIADYAMQRTLYI